MIALSLLDQFAPDREFIRPEEYGQPPPDGSALLPPFDVKELRYDVLDRGYLHVKESWGSDEEIVETARMSTDKGFLGWEPGECPTCRGNGFIQKNDYDSFECPSCAGRGRIPGDANLLKHLYEHKHSTPFEFAGLTIEVQAPLMVFREWHRHRTQSYSEMSARFVKMPDIHYVPSIARIVACSRKSRNKQASGGGVIQIPGIVGKTEEEMAAQIQELIRSEQARIYSLYGELLSFGVAKEIARVDTPVSRYSRMRATGNLRNWLAFLTLRMDPHAQFEIRQFAWCVADVIARVYPRTYELFFKDMLPLLEPNMAPKKLLGEAYDLLLKANLGMWEPDIAFNEAPQLMARIQKALGREAA